MQMTRTFLLEISSRKAFIKFSFSAVCKSFALSFFLHTTGNMGNMLLIIIPAVCKEKGSPFGSPEVCHSYGMGYVSLSMAVCSFSTVLDLRALDAIKEKISLFQTLFRTTLEEVHLFIWLWDLFMFANCFVLKP